MKCLRCGAEVKDRSMFCPDCNKVVSVPLKPSPYLNRKVCLPKRRPVQTIKRPEEKKPEKKQHRAGGWILFSALLLLVCAAFLLQGAYIYEQKGELEEEITRLQFAGDECVRLTDQLRQAEGEIEALEQELSRLGSTAYLQIREDLKQTQAKNEALIQELDRTQDEIASYEAQWELSREKLDFFDTHIVFLQDDDPNVFHSYDCEKFTRNGYRAYNKQQAIALEYTPCLHCQ